MKEFFSNVLKNIDKFSENNPFLYNLILIFLIILFSIVAYYIVKNLVVKRGLKAIFDRTKTHWDGLLLERGLFNPLIFLVPISILYLGANIFGDYSFLFQNTLQSLTAIVVISFLNRALDSFYLIYSSTDLYKKRPIYTSHIQVIKLIIICLGGLVAIASFIGKSPWGLLGSIGAFTAILLLVFKDTILSFVASIQLSSNDIIKVGDWVEVPAYNADGSVTEMALNTVKVQNWNNTITTIPTYALVSTTVTNWRGMLNSGGRRIKRSVLIDQKSIKFCTADMLEKYKNIKLLKDYIANKLEDIEKYNTENKAKDSLCTINGRNLTNIGTFRAYLIAYLKNHPMVNQEMILLVRQLDPTPKGLPIELYIFCKDKAWVNYENIQADIFDHILAIAPEFDLRVFQEPSGYDLTQILENKNN